MNCFPGRLEFKKNVQAVTRSLEPRNYAGFRFRWYPQLITYAKATPTIRRVGCLFVLVFLLFVTQSVELLPGELPYFRTVTGPTELPMDLDPFIQKDKIVVNPFHLESAESSLFPKVPKFIS